MESIINPVKLTIVIPVINCFNFTEQLIKTIKSPVKYRILIIDNGSNEDDLIKLDELCKDPKIDVIYNNRNIGVAAAWNQGVKWAFNKNHSDYILICNNDIILRNDTIENLLSIIDNHDILLVTGTDTHAKNQNIVGLFTSPIPDNIEIKDCPEFPLFLIKKETIDRVGYFDENYWPAYFEDNDYHYRIRLASARGVNINTAMYYHFRSQTIRNNSDIKDVSDNYYLNNQAYYIQKWGSVPGSEKYIIPFNKCQSISNSTP